MIKSAASAVILVLSLSACQSMSVEAPEPTAAELQQAAELRGAKFAQNRCSDCHAVTSDAVSPNPNAPTFAMIANRQGLTSDTLTVWLKDAHNYPREMYFEIPAEHIDDLTAYLVTLQSDDYTPPIQ